MERGGEHNIRHGPLMQQDDRDLGDKFQLELLTITGTKAQKHVNTNLIQVASRSAEVNSIVDPGHRSSDLNRLRSSIRQYRIVTVKGKAKASIITRIH